MSIVHSERRPMSAGPEAPERTIVDMSDEDFKRLVDEDIRGQTTPEVAAALRSEAVIERFHHQLQATVVFVDGLIAEKEAILAQVTAKHAKWLAGTMKFKTGLDLHLLDVRRIYDGRGLVQFKSYAAVERDWALERARRLEEAINEHRASLQPEDADEADVALWAALLGV